MQPAEMLRNLMVMALADGVLTEDEIAYLREQRELWGVSEADFDQAMEYAQSSDGQMSYPEDPDKRRQLLEGLVHMMAADGDISHVELNLFALAAVKLGVDDQQLDAIIDRAIGEDDLLLGE